MEESLKQEQNGEGKAQQHHQVAARVPTTMNAHAPARETHSTAAVGRRPASPPRTRRARRKHSKRRNGRRP
ncbi:unnamed protein product [Linum trigynum]|uniref:Uncharacterized protein n=1 Tax=Linum trigynum TaxID=586398 RepID=A0AAV2DQH3_9ROSI